MQSSVHFRYEPLLTRLVNEYQLFWTPEEKSRCLNIILQLQKPCHPERTFQDTPESALATGNPGVPSSVRLDVLPVQCALAGPAGC